MVTKRTKRSTKKVTSLKAKGLTSKQAKGVKGGSGDENPTERHIPNVSLNQMPFQKV
jgi:hypothetical protein